MTERREAKRARQACLNCRRKKARCSGEKPVCAFCARLAQDCQWDDPSAETPPRTLRAFSTSEDTALATRVALLEAKLSLLNDDQASSIFRSLPEPRRAPAAAMLVKSKHDRDSLGSEASAGALSGTSEFSPLPSRDIFLTLIDIYFEQCHNQPYGWFHEATFRHSFNQGLLPDYLLYAFAAAACRFCDHEFYRGRQQEAIATYTNASWSQIFEDSFSYDGQLEFCMVQATSILAAIDYTSGHKKLGWVKFSLSVRFAQSLRLNEEPDELLSVAEKEERRRTFWSVYLLDQLISLGPNRPPSFNDADCTVRLPCSEKQFRNNDDDNSMPTLEALIEDPTAQSHHELDYFAALVLMASALGRFLRFSMKRTPSSTPLLWDPRSQYYKVHAILLHFEALSSCTLSTTTETLRTECMLDGRLDRPVAGHFIFSQALFHLNHCLLNHPFVLHHIFQHYTAPIPPSFVQEALQRCQNHATYLLDLLHEAQQFAKLANSSFHGYCALAAGMIHRLYETHSDPVFAETSRARVATALSFLEPKHVRWVIYDHMASLLRSFEPDSETSGTLTDAFKLSQKLPLPDGDRLWQLLDYARLPEKSKSSQSRTHGPQASAAEPDHTRISHTISEFQDESLIDANSTPLYVSHLPTALADDGHDSMFFHMHTDEHHDPAYSIFLHSPFSPG